LTGGKDVDKKTEGKVLEEKLFHEFKNGWEKASQEEKNQIFDFSEGYKDFLNKCKTERECAAYVETVLKKNGFEDIEKILNEGKVLKPGMKVYLVNKKKSIAAAVIGREPLEKGLNIVGSHIDSPRIDLKQSPLYEDGDTGLAMLKTHYYGGIKKYQWVTIPLSMHGVIVKQNGETVEVNIGEKDGDPVFTITDLLPHLAQDQMKKEARDVVTGEGLNILFGSMPYHDEEVKKKVKLNVLDILNREYGIIEEDFISAEIEFVPSTKAQDVGIDRSLVGGYGQDDRVSAYTSLMAFVEVANPERTSVLLLTDREEVGSMGNTGAESSLMADFASILCYLQDKAQYSDMVTRITLRNSKMLSADVNAAVDPTYSDVQDKTNATYLGKGVIIQKYTGSRGKYGGSEASAEFIAQLRDIFNKSQVLWQTGELGKVDVGGGGTIAQFMANLGIEVVDCGVAMLSMHSPFEVTSKIDIYHCYKSYKVFYEKV